MLWQRWTWEKNIDFLGKVEVFQDFSHFFTNNKGVNSIDRLPVSISSIDWPDFLFFEPPVQRAQRLRLVMSSAGPSANADQFTATLAATGAH